MDALGKKLGAEMPGPIQQDPCDWVGDLAFAMNVLFEPQPGKSPWQS